MSEVNKHLFCSSWLYVKVCVKIMALIQSGSHSKALCNYDYFKLNWVKCFILDEMTLVKQYTVHTIQIRPVKKGGTCLEANS